ncbi:MAG TPA: hypothetical protein VKX25_09365 [Bryobacteraceae bacterium]|jgi:hypothetical protein|nr:hypothetical protein [Bryobacteraceae bacterium]
MKKTAISFALAAGLCALPAFTQSVGQDAKDAAHDTKTASEKGYKKSTSAVKKGATKSTHATKKGVHKAADKVSDKTTTT